ncbi:hypothetical protein D3C73_1512520 [compost metagenome]
MMEEAQSHKKEMDFFSDFQLLMNGGNAIGGLLSGLLLAFLPIWGCFLMIAAIRVAILFSYKQIVVSPAGRAGKGSEKRITSQQA